MGLAYNELGLYAHTRRLQSETIKRNREMGAMSSLATALGNIIDPEMKSGMFDSARAHLEEYAKLVPGIGDPNAISGLQSTYGDLAFEAGDTKKAIKLYKSAVKMLQEAGLARENVVLAELGKIYLAAKDPVNALKATTRATDLHRAQNFAKPDGFTSQAIWWRHTQALLANKKTKEAREALDKAYEFVLESIENVRDEGLRRNLLNKVLENRELLQYWAKEWQKRNSKNTSRYAPVMPHLAIESNLREPFKRLADTGLRLNTLHTVGEIQTFIVEEATELIGGERVMLILENNRKPEVADSILPRGEDASAVLASIKKHLAQARLTRTVQLVTDHRRQTTDHGKSKKHRPSSIVHRLGRIIAPLIAQNTLLGYLYVDMDALYGKFDDTDRDMLGMLANQGAVALDNAGLITGLERKVEERTAQLQEHISELQIINSIQQGLAAELDFQAIVDLVGDKLREVFNTPELGITWYEEKANLVHYLYMYEHGKRITTPAAHPNPGGIYETEIKTRKPLVLNNKDDFEKINMRVIPGTDQAKSMVIVPIISSDRFLGDISLENFERENAYGESELRLLTTIAASLGTALENARLFDETQRLFKAEQERVAELQIINSIQQGLAAELDFQAIWI